MTLSNRAVEKLTVEKDTVFWDRELTGFGVRIYPSGGKVYVAQARGPDGPKRVTVGRHRVIGAEQARQRAALVIARVKAGESPVPEPLAAKQGAGPTVGELAERFLEEYAVVRYKPGTLAWTRTVVRRYIVPELGKLALAAVERTQVRELHHRLSHTPSIANMVVRTLSLMYRLAEDWGLVSEGCNPCRSVVRYPQRKRERFLTDEEFIRLGQVLDEVEKQGGASPAAVAAIRLLMLTGCRKSEIITLRWEHVAIDAGELRLPDSKTGPRVISLPPMAVTLLAGLPREPDSPWVIPGRYPGTHLRDLADAWKVIRTRAGLVDVRIHDLRHSFASRALALGESLPMIGKLLGHSQVETTARYAHLARDTVHESAARVAGSLALDLFGDEWRAPAM
ncbi:MAG: tyrosine-type recombinase/integrase [Rhodospirillaceae bacterium]|nr:tyrosine-type recombinase/integrase [Rhodospirillaceae bacterium]